MEAYKETILSSEDIFPVEVFVKDNSIENLSVTSHWHDCIEVLCYLEGEATQKIDDRVFTASAGDVVIVKMGVVHSTHCEDDACCKVLVLKFMPHLIDGTYSYIDAKYVHLFFASEKEGNDHLRGIVSENSEVSQLLYRILDEDRQQQPAYELIVKGAIYQFVGMLIREGGLGIPAGDLDRESYQTFRPVLAHIESEYMNPIDMTAMASLAGMSYYHFSRGFKEVVGISFKEYVDRVRVAEADKLIVSTDNQFAAIAYETGFNSVTSFNRVYKRIKGMTPGMMRRSSNT